MGREKKKKGLRRGSQAKKDEGSEKKPNQKKKGIRDFYKLKKSFLSFIKFCETECNKTEFK